MGDGSGFGADTTGRGKGAGGACGGASTGAAEGGAGATGGGATGLGGATGCGSSNTLTSTGGVGPGPSNPLLRIRSKAMSTATEIANAGGTSQGSLRQGVSAALAIGMAPYSCLIAMRKCAAPTSRARSIASTTTPLGAPLSAATTTLPA